MQHTAKNLFRSIGSILLLVGSLASAQDGVPSLSDIVAYNDMGHPYTAEELRVESSAALIARGGNVCPVAGLFNLLSR
jgi:hypothetical protein